MVCQECCLKMMGARIDHSDVVGLCELIRYKILALKGGYEGLFFVRKHVPGQLGFKIYFLLRLGQFLEA